MLNVLSDLKWHKLELHLKSIHAVKRMEHPLAIFQSIIKNITNSFNHYERSHIIFHLLNYNFSEQIRENKTYRIEIIFVRHNSQFIKTWKDRAEEYFKNPLKRNFILQKTGDIQDRSGEIILKETGINDETEEVCLDFLSPIPFNPLYKKRRFILSEKSFIELYQRRFTGLFGSGFKLPLINTSDFTILPYYWEFKSVTHFSQTRRDTKLMIKGCVGRLYIKGNLKNIRSLLALGSELHTGGKLSYSLGHYTLLKESPAFFTPALQDKEHFISFARTIMSESDKRFDDIKETNSKNEKKILDAIWEQVSNKSYKFSPARAYLAKNREKKRIIEDLSLEDYIVQRFLLMIIHKAIDNVFEYSSLGYRKGKSIDTVFLRIEELLNDGYHLIFESDIEDFFPSIDHEKMEAILKFYFPEKDHAVCGMIAEAFRAGFIINNRLKNRVKGLALGSPLSPLLTNLYMDSFDERFLDNDLTLLRYSDDFIIMAKTKEAIEKAALRTQLALKEIGLNCKESKTKIVDYKNGFQFLGRYFSPEGNVHARREISNALKKTLYITEPFAFLGLNGEALEIKKGTRVLQTLPLNRIEAIVAMERVSFSSNLVKKCVDKKIPITITLNSGYFVTTIKPDSKQFFDVISSHCSRFSQLSEGEKLLIAQQFVIHKIQNYQAFLISRKKRGGDITHLLKITIDFITEMIEKAKRSSTIPELRGIEGSVSRKMFSTYNLLVKPSDFHIHKRDSRRPDQINSLLNYGYYLLFTRLNTLIRGQGLNPYLGFLHSEADRYESFTCDLEELFRARIDQFLIKIINLNVVTAKDFEKQSRGLFMVREKKKLFLELFERNLLEKRSQKKRSLIEAMEWQVKLFKDWAVNGSELEFYKWGDT